MWNRTPIRKILIVDDERDLVEPLVLRLKADGRFAVEAAYDGREGLRQALASPPDAALIDLDLPEIDGWSLCRLLRENPHTRRTRVIVMTAWAGRDFMRRARAEGAVRILLKPFEDDELLDALAAEGAGSGPLAK